jgi:hypothetical protein
MSKQRYCKMVMAIPGPKAPTCMDAYLDALGAQLAKLAAGECPMQRSA